MMLSLDEALLFESMSRHCFFYKASNDKWYMELADREYYNEDEPEPGSKWGDGEQESATTYGPFSTEDAAMDYLDNFSNPGSFGTDDSGKAPPPTKSPNGRPVESPGGRSQYGSSRSYGFSGGYNTPRQREPEYVAPPVTPPSQARDVARRVAAKKAKVAAASPAPPAKGGKKTTYKIYNGTGTGKAVTGSSPIHTRIKGKVYAPTIVSKFRGGSAATVEPDGDDLKVTDPSSGHTQRWTKRESVEKTILDMIELLNS